MGHEMLLAAARPRFACRLESEMTADFVNWPRIPDAISISAYRSGGSMPNPIRDATRAQEIRVLTPMDRGQNIGGLERRVALFWSFTDAYVLPE